MHIVDFACCRWSWSLVWIIQPTSSDTDAEATDIAVAEFSSKAISMRVRMGVALVVAGVALQNIAVDRLRLHAMQLLRHYVGLAKGALALNTGSTRVHAILDAVDNGERVGLVDWPRHMASA